MKISHKELFLYTLEFFMKQCMGGDFLVMKSASQVPGDIPRIFIRYRCRSQSVLGFIALDGE